MRLVVGDDEERHGANRLRDSFSEKSHVEAEQCTGDDPKRRFVRHDQDIAFLVPGADLFDDAHRTRGDVKSGFAARRPATGGIVCPVGKGLRPSLHHFVLLQPLPLAVVDFFQPLFNSRLEASLMTQRRDGLPRAQHGTRVDGLPFHRRICRGKRACHGLAHFGQWRVRTATEAVLPARGGLPVPNHVQVHRPRSVADRHGR